MPVFQIFVPGNAVVRFPPSLQHCAVLRSRMAALIRNNLHLSQCPCCSPKLLGGIFVSALEDFLGRTAGRQDCSHFGDPKVDLGFSGRSCRRCFVFCSARLVELTWRSSDQSLVTPCIGLIRSFRIDCNSSPGRQCVTIIIRIWMAIQRFLVSHHLPADSRPDHSRQRSP